MASRIKYVLRGIGSLFVLMPPSSSTQRLIVRDPAERLRRPWERTGRAIRQAVERFEREQKVAP